MLTTDFFAVLPELILSVGGIALMMVAAFAGDRAAQTVNALAAIIIALAIVAVAAHGPAVSAFHDTVRSDGFAAYAKYLIFGSAIVALLLAPRFFAAEGYRAEYPVLIVFATLGMAIMASAHDLITLYIGLELQSLSAYVLASFMRTDPRSSEAGAQIFRARRARQRHPALRTVAALRVHWHDELHRHRARIPGARQYRADLRPRVRDRRARVQIERGAVPHVDA